MKKQIKTTLITTGLLLLITPATYANAQEDTTLLKQEAQAIVKQFMGQLKPELQKSMKADGPAKTVNFCQTKAPKIAQALAQKTGWDINRVSLKPRGKHAQPDPWETAVLKRFNTELAQGVSPKTMAFSEIVTVNNQQQFRYMKAIPTGGVCLTCHGSDIMPPVQKSLQNHYPNDAATGYSKGEIRGAFSFSKAL